MNAETNSLSILSEHKNTLDYTKPHSAIQSQLDDAQCERDGFWDKHIVCMQPKPPVLSCDIERYHQTEGSIDQLVGMITNPKAFH